MICASSAYICSSHTCIHMLITMVPRDKPRTSTDIDRAVSAEIPDKETNPELHRIVTSHMIHGPCGHWNLDSPCMVDRKCSKDYPKQLRQDTSFSDNSYPLYRMYRSQRWSEGALMCLVNHAWVVPYNPYILLRYNAHINLEIVCAVSSVKYLYTCLMMMALPRTYWSQGHLTLHWLPFLDPCLYIHTCDTLCPQMYFNTSRTHRTHFNCGKKG